MFAAINAIHVVVTKHELFNDFLMDPALAEAFCTLLEDLRPHPAHQLTVAAALMHLCSKEQASPAQRVASPEQAKLQPYTDAVQRRGTSNLIIDVLIAAMRVSKMNVCT